MAMSKVNGTRRDGRRAARRRWAIAWLGFSAVCVAAVWYFLAVFVPHERALAVEVWRGRLSAMADDRKAAITAWLGERRGDAEVVAAYPTVAVLLAGPTAVPFSLPPWELPEHHLQGLLDSVRAAYGYNGIYVVDSTGHVAAASAGSAPLEESCRQIDREVMHTGRARLDFQAHADGSPMLAIAAPVRVNGRTAGTVLLSADPGRWLYPFLRSEPTPSATGESLLVRQVGDQIEFLSPLRHSSAPPLSFRVSSKTSHLAAASAVRGEERFARYVDYRGVPALGVTRWLQDARWGLVVKVDEDEALSGFRRSVRQVALAIAGLLVAMAGLGFGAQRGIAARHRRELGESEARFALLRDHANDAILFASRDGMILDVNRRAEQLYVRRREELLGLPFDELRVPEERAALRDRLDALARDEELVFEAVHRRPDGSRFPVEVSIRVMELGDQEVFLSIVRDITERKRVEEELRESEDRFRYVFEYSILGKSITQPTGEVQVNRAFAEMLGYSIAEMTAMRWQDVTHPDDVAETQQVIDSVVAGEREFARFAKRYIHKSGSVVWTDVATSVRRDKMGVPLYFMTSVIDVTEHKRAEEELRQSEERYRSLFENMTEGFAYCRMLFESGIPRDFVYLDVNPSFERLTGLRDVVGRRASEVIRGIREADPGLFTILGRVALTGQSERLETYLQSMGIWFAISVYSVQREHFVVVFDNITERKAAEEALRLAHLRTRRFIDSNIVGTVIADASGNIVEANDYYLRLIGFTREEMAQGKVDWRAITPPEWLPVDERAIAELREHGTCTPYEKEYLRRDGTRVAVLLADALLPGPEEQIAAFALDITERQRAQDALQQQAAELAVRNEELERFNRSAVGRENRMVELKRQVNELCKQLGRPPEYPLGFLDAESQSSVAAPAVKREKPPGAV